MFSYIYMKILEARPERYDAGISRISHGRADRVKEEIVKRFIKPGDDVLDIGTGTGTLALLAAGAGAKVLGIDASEKMLAVAESKRQNHPQKERTSFRHMPVYDLDLLSADEPFDVVTASLVFSELDGDEMNYSVRHAFRLLKPGGLMVIADETRPNEPLKRLFYLLVRFPMACITILLTKRSTHPVEGLEEVVDGAGFSIESTERRSMGTFLLLCARKP